MNLLLTKSVYSVNVSFALVTYCCLANCPKMQCPKTTTICYFHDCANGNKGVRLLEKTQDPKRWYLSTVSCRQRIQIATALKYSLSSKAAIVPERPGVSSNHLLSIRPYQDTLSVLDQELLTDVWTSQNLGAWMKSFIRISYTLAGPHFPSR